MFHIVVALIAISVCYKWGDMKNWKLYYPTILFFIIGDLSYNVITYNNPLWLYYSPLLKHTFSDLLIDITVYPSTVLVFVPNFPKGTYKRGLYISYYVLIYTFFEFVSLRLGYIIHFNGWNIMSSIIFNYVMFIMIILHHKKPLIAWSLVLVAPHILLYLYKIPYSMIR